MALVVFLIVVVLASFPATWLLMLFLGNVGLTAVGFWGALPGGILLTSIIGGIGASRRDW